MKYMIMECHKSYAIALDDSGRFLKVANIHYEVGQVVEYVYEMQEEVIEKKKNYSRLFYRLTTVFACSALLLVGFNHYLNLQVYGSVYMRINPSIKIDVNRYDKVINIEAENNDGVNLIEEYDYKNKNINSVVDELVDKAIEMKYLNEGGTINLTLNGDGDWKLETSDNLKVNLDKHLNNKLSANLTINDNDENEITYPIGTDDLEDDSDYSDEIDENDFDEIDDKEADDFDVDDNEENNENNVDDIDDENDSNDVEEVNDDVTNYKEN